MSREKKVKLFDSNEAVRLWYRRHDGLSAYVVKYQDPFGSMASEQDKFGEFAPLYVALEGHEPRPLADALEELEHLRDFKSRLNWSKVVECPERLERAFDRIIELEERVDTVEQANSKKRWWRRKK